MPTGESKAVGTPKAVFCSRPPDRTYPSNLTAPVSANAPHDYNGCNGEHYHYPDVASTLSFAKARGWIDECAAEHVDCPGNTKPATQPPTRLLDVSPRKGNAKTVRLVQTLNWPSRDFSQWATLSYSWGGDQPHKTTRENLASHLKGITVQDMPQTIQDAITVCRKLGIPYIWIDSLCIIQKDGEDLGRELAQMPRIYQGSLVTIYAASAHAVTEGFLHQRPLYYRKFVPTKLKSLGIHAQDGKNHDYLILSESVSSDNSYQTLDSYKPLEPLDRRAWAFQERMLSPRTLIYSCRELSWQCRGAVLRSGNDRQWTWPYRYAPPCRPGKETPPWEELVKEYSNCLLSEDADKLTAIAAIAEFYQSEHSKTYAAGLWREDLPLSLCWYMSASYLEIRPPGYRAPSWSWASVNGRITEHPMPGKESHAELLDVTIVPGSQIAPLASVVSGSLTIRAEMVSAILQMKIYGGKGEFFVNASLVSIDEAECRISPPRTGVCPKLTWPTYGRHRCESRRPRGVMGQMQLGQAARMVAAGCNRRLDGLRYRVDRIDRTGTGAGSRCCPSA